MSDDKKNGNGANGHDKSKNEKKGDIIHFPSLAERDRLEREKRENEKKWQKEYQKRRSAAPQVFGVQGASIKGDQPMFNWDRIPPFAGIFAAGIIIIHLITNLFIPPEIRYELFFKLGFVPAYYTGEMEWSWWALAGPISHVLLHGGWMHIILNAIMGLALGMAFEKTSSTRTAVLFFILCTLGGAAFHFVLSPDSTVPVIGASSGISGLFAATLMLFHAQGRIGTRSRYGVWPIIGFWIALFIGLGLLGGGSVAWQAHLGGFLSGLALFQLWAKGYIRL